MYTRRERPLSEAERQQLSRQLHALADSMGGQVGLVVTVLAIDALLVSAAVVMYLDGGLGSICGSLCWILGLLLVNFWAAVAVGEFGRNASERRLIREALADGAAVAERVAARRLVQLSSPGNLWYLFAVGPDEVAVLSTGEAPFHFHEPRPDPKASAQVAACFETVTTRRHRLPLGTTTLGHAGFNIPSYLELARVMPDPQQRLAVETRLGAHPLLRGCLSDLPALLGSPPLEGDVAGDPYDELQARVEDRFNLDFGPGGLARLRPESVPQLVDLIHRRLPEGAAFRAPAAANAFYRLRAALAEVLGVPRWSIRPGTRLEDLVPRRGRRRLWRRVGERLGQPVEAFAGGQLPGCTLFAWGVALMSCWLFGFPVLILARACGLRYDLTERWWFQGPLLAGSYFVPLATVAGVTLVGLLLWRRARRPEFDPGRATVGAVARGLAGPGAEQVWSEENVYLAVRRLAAGLRGCRPMEVTWATRLN